MRSGSVVIFLLATCSLIKCENIEKKIIDPNGNEAIVGSVLEVIVSFYLKETSILDFIVSTSENPESRREAFDIANEIIKKTDSKISIVLEDVNAMNDIDRKKAFNVHFVDSYRSFRNILSKLKLEDFDFQGYFLIVLTNVIGSYREIKMMLEDLWSNYIVNVNIIHSVSQNSSDMFTYFPFSEFYCEKVFPVKLNTYRIAKGFLHQTHHFQNKVADLHKCPVSVVTFINPPFIFPIGDRIDGLDGLLINMLSYEINFTLKTNILKTRIYGELLQNGSATGAMGMVMRKEANFSIGHFALSLDRTKHMSSTYVYFTSYMVWVIPIGTPLTSMQRFLKPFQKEIWFALNIALVIGVVFIIFIKYQSREVRNFIFGTNVRYPVLNMFNVMFGGVVTITPRRNFARTLLGLFMMFTLVLRNAYTGALFRFLQADTRNEPITEIDDLIEANYKFYIQGSMNESVQHSWKISQNIKLTTNSQIENIYQKIRNSEKFTVLSTEEHIAYWNNIKFPNIYHTCPEKHSAIHLVIYLHKDSCLTQEFSKQILRYHEIGIIYNLNRSYRDKLKLKIKGIDKGPKQLTLNNLSGGFYLLVLGGMQASICFIIEIFFRSRVFRHYLDKKHGKLYMINKI